MNHSGILFCVWLHLLNTMFVRFIHIVYAVGAEELPQACSQGWPLMGLPELDSSLHYLMMVTHCAYTVQGVCCIFNTCLPSGRLEFEYMTGRGCNLTTQ